MTGGRPSKCATMLPVTDPVVRCGVILFLLVYVSVPLMNIPDAVVCADDTSGRLMNADAGKFEALAPPPSRASEDVPLPVCSSSRRGRRPRR